MASQAESDGRMVTERDDLGAFEVMRELTRNGYVIDGGDERSSGIRLRHDSAPDLILHADGRIEVPLGQKRKSAITGLMPGVRRGLSWRRTIAMIILLGGLWFLAVFLSATFLESM